MLNTNQDTTHAREKTKISILSHDLSINCLGRAYILAKALHGNCDVEILGPMSKSGLWKPVAHDGTIVYKKFGILPNPFTYIRAISGDVIYAVKPRAGSFGYGLLAKWITGKKLVLDIDDWETGFFRDYSFIGKILNAAQVWNMDSILYTSIFSRLIRFADAVTVSNLFLQKRFGGVLIPHFRDTGEFDPARFDRLSIRERLGLQDKQVVMFMGTVKMHKGINTLIAAFDQLDAPDFILMLVGANPRIQKKLPKRSYLKVVGPQPFDKVPEFLAAADLVAIMQKQTSASAQGQLPAKIFDAMAMAKPIIATAVSDIPKVLSGGCGLVISDNAVELAQAIKAIFGNPKLAEKMGQAARRKCISEYSYQAARPALASVFNRLK
jgi:glycosyltransferase involved in cell wall biosynthesis